MKSIFKAALVVAAGLFAAGTAPASAQIGVYTITDLNIRSGPGVDYTRIAVIPEGGEVTVFGCTPSRIWCDIAWAGWRGWVAADYLHHAGYRRPLYEPGPGFVRPPVVRYNYRRYHDRYYRGRPFYRRPYYRSRY